MYEFRLTEEQQAYQQLAREFVEQEIKPTVRERERIADPAERFPWDIVEKASHHGLRTLAAPKEYGGGGADSLTLCVVGEELAAGDLGIGVIFDQTWKLTRLLFRVCNPDQTGRYLKPFLADHRALLALGGIRHAVGSEASDALDASEAEAETFAERRDGAYVVNGAKRFIATTPEAGLYTVLARTDRGKRYAEGGLSAFLVRKGAPGFRTGKIYGKVGRRLINDGELIFENCRVPEEDRLLGEGQFFPTLERFIQRDVGAAATALGVARAAFEAAVSWAEQRVQGGKPIIQHQAIGLMLAEMAIKLETARLMVLKAAWAADHQEPFDFRLPSMAQSYAAEAAFDVCRLATETFGGYGIMADLPMEKYLRDATTCLHSDGTHQIHRLRVAEGIRRGLV